MRADAESYVARIDAALDLVKMSLDWDRALRRLDELGIKAVGAADQKHQTAHAAIPQLCDLLGESARRPGPSAFIAGDDMAVGKMMPQGLGFGGLSGFATVDVDHLDRPKPHGSPRDRGAIHIELHEFGFRRASQATDGDNGDFHVIMTTRSAAVRRSELH